MVSLVFKVSTSIPLHIPAPLLWMGSSGCCVQAIHGLKKLGIPKYVWDEAHLRDVNGWQLQERTGDTFDAAMGEVAFNAVCPAL